MNWIIIVAYILLLCIISYCVRRHPTVDEYLMADRKASTIQVTAGVFTLIGGGELVTMASLGFVYGNAGMALFIGYSIAFVFLGFIAKKIRVNATEKKYVSLPDYMHDNFGKASGFLAFTFSFLAFFALLMLQFATAGSVISPFTELSYAEVVLLVGLVVLAYLLVGGFRAVLITDVVQGVAMLVLMPLLAFIVFSSAVDVATPVIEVVVLPLAIWISLIVTGFFVAAASADVWQRAYAAKNDNVARNGMILAGILFLVFGYILISIGISARELGIADSNIAFIETVTTHLPPWASFLAILMVLSAVMSTSDTEMFLLTGMLQREIKRFPVTLGKIKDYIDTVLGARIVMLLVGIIAISFALRFSDLVDIYIWLLSAIIVISPLVLFSLFKKTSPKGMFVSMLANTLVFSVLMFSNLISVDTIYLISIPGFVFYGIALAWSRIEKQVKE